MAAPADRLLVVDENLSPRQAAVLVRRGRQATSIKAQGLLQTKDDPLLEELAKRFSGQDWILTTADDAMPLEHKAALVRLGITVATVAPSPLWVVGPAAEEWKWETVQRWAHVIATQATCSIRRYWPTRHARWTVPRR